MSSDCLAGNISDVVSLGGLDCVKLGPRVICCASEERTNAYLTLCNPSQKLI